MVYHLPSVIDTSYLNEKKAERLHKYCNLEIQSSSQLKENCWKRAHRYAKITLNTKQNIKKHGFPLHLFFFKIMLEQHFLKSILWNISASLCFHELLKYQLMKGLFQVLCLKNTAYVTHSSWDTCLWNKLEFFVCQALHVKSYEQT